MTVETKIEDDPTPIGRLFKRLGGTYGAAWMRSFGAEPVANVKTVWAHELSWFFSAREPMNRVAWALENLPELPPNVIAFKNLCRAAPAPVVPRLEEPKADPERIAAELEKLTPLRRMATSCASANKDWARRIIARHAAGDPTVGRESLRSARIALRMHAGA